MKILFLVKACMCLFFSGQVKVFRALYKYDAQQVRQSSNLSSVMRSHAFIHTYIDLHT